MIWHVVCLIFPLRLALDVFVVRCLSVRKETWGQSIAIEFSVGHVPPNEVIRSMYSSWGQSSIKHFITYACEHPICAHFQTANCGQRISANPHDRTSQVSNNELLQTANKERLNETQSKVSAHVQMGWVCLFFVSNSVCTVDSFAACWFFSRLILN